MAHKVPGLTRRGNRSYYHRRFPKAVGGDRIYKSLEADAGSDLAVRRAAAVNTLWERGDWSVLRRWQAGRVHVSELQRAVREGDWDRLKRLNTEGVRLGDAAQRHLARTEATRSQSTAASHRVACEAFVQRWGADLPMHTLTVAEVEAFLHEPKDHLGERPWAPKTQRQYRMVGGALWRFAAEREREAAEAEGALPTLARNPWRRARIPEARPVRPAVLTKAEMRDLLANDAVRGTPTAALLACAAWGGLRAQEITHLRVGVDVVLDGRRPKLIVQSRKGGERWTTKTHRSERDVEITPALVAILRTHLRKGFHGERYLFRGDGKRDGPIAPHTARTWTRKAYTAAGIRYGRGGEGLTLHNLRHSHATMLLSEGTSLATVAERLGDTQEVILSTYSHAIPSDRERALRIIEDAATGAA